MLYTNLKHIESAAEHAQIIGENENVVVICGRMEPMCVPVYRIAEELEKEYAHVGKVDIQQYESLAQKFKVRSIPTLILFKNGTEINRFVGIKSKEFLLKEIAKAG